MLQAVIRAEIPKPTDKITAYDKCLSKDEPGFNIVSIQLNN
jgi:hypothetical protein